MEVKLDELWLEAVELQVEQQVVRYLRSNHEDYKNMQNRVWELLAQYPILNELTDSADEIKLNAEEHRALREFIQIQDGIQRLEKEYSYYYGQSNVFSYGRILKNLYQEIQPEGEVPMKHKLMDMIVEKRTCEAELEYQKKDEEFQKRVQEVLKQEEAFKNLNPSEEIREQVGLLTEAISDRWIRYTDMLYQSAWEEVLAFLIER